ncbi:MULTISPECIES: hypothetical protein [unclassified Bradyrhizobium]|jgi:hypothetical protein|uniref:hypothetical protein n=1 Tax=unclassified Bradyrhizobium TaxID=2631580 RepID=UPI001FF7E4E7|nr:MULTISPECIES: hypothetical protein [unclassified Bradyrhizobium]MCK1518895.1 hypothetical protein [Bradyrhizobium sp. 17]MCK1689695.1 hypothetical protein [Bradyrhizobium sp. 145]
MPGVSQNSALVRYALEGLERCWLPEHGRWSHIYHLDGRTSPNESLPHSDVFYTLNVLLGMSRIRETPSSLNLSDVFHRNAVQLTLLPVRKYALGMALWAAAELGFEVPEQVRREVRALLTEQERWKAFRAQDLGMLLTGVVAQVGAGGDEWTCFAGPLYRFLKQRFHSGSGLFFDAGFGLRRRFASFATQIYLSIACYHYGELAGDSSALAMAGACARKLIELQGPRGEWPWFFDAVSGRVLDFYEVYSVHQYGMAPALLEWAERYDVPGARNALIKGFNWILGENQLRRSMLVPDLGLTIRSQIRKGEVTARAPRMLRAIGNAYRGRESELIESSGVGLRLECRSYELGWILWSFGQRNDLPELACNPAFGRAHNARFDQLAVPCDDAPIAQQ